jgi:protein arginine kinase activator
MTLDVPGKRDQSRPELEAMVMKCQHCEKPATFHITELTGSRPQELHFCEDHARVYLTQADQADSETSSLAGALAQQFNLGQTAQELARLDQQACPVCGITFYEFRQQGRLGCPHDYVAFEKELEPLIVNIHGANRHAGKRPQRVTQSTDQRTEVIRLRREMKEAIEKEQYERASSLRDQIRAIERPEQSSGRKGRGKST